jgi:hypothetical protein
MEPNGLLSLNLSGLAEGSNGKLTMRARPRIVRNRVERKLVGKGSAQTFHRLQPGRLTKTIALSEVANYDGKNLNSTAWCSEG